MFPSSGVMQHAEALALWWLLKQDCKCSILSVRSLGGIKMLVLANELTTWWANCASLPSMPAPRTSDQHSLQSLLICHLPSDTNDRWLSWLFLLCASGPLEWELRLDLLNGWLRVSLSEAFNHFLFSLCSLHQLWGFQTQHPDPLRFTRLLPRMELCSCARWS